MEIRLFANVGKPRQSVIEIQDMTPFKGGHSPKDLICSEILGQGEKKKSFKWVRRARSANRSRDYLFNWKELKSRGFPVVNTLRSDEKFHYIPDLTQDGSRVYGRGLYELLVEKVDVVPDKDFTSLFYSPSELDEVFVNIVLSNAIELQKQIDFLLDRARTQKVKLPEDPFVLYIRPDKSWELLLLDVERASFDCITTTLDDENSKILNENKDDLRKLALFIAEELKRASS